MVGAALTAALCQGACDNGRTVPMEGAPDASASDVPVGGDRGPFPNGQCVFGFDDTCNEDPTVRTPLGTCQANGGCVCGANPRNPDTGHCLAPGHDVTSGCELNGVIHPDGSSFPCADGCNTCGCAGRTVYATTSMLCGALSCGLDDVLTFAYVGVLDSQDRVTLTPDPTGAPAVTYVHAHTDASGATTSCSPAPPVCGDADIIDISDIAAELKDPVVRELLMNPGPQPLSLGAGTSPILALRRGAGPGILVGSDCDGGTTACNAVPAGIRRLAFDLAALDNAQIDGNRSCEVLAPPTFACGAAMCDSRTQYCARVEVNGARKLDVCRPYPSGCDSCACARDDAMPALQQVYPGCSVSLTWCSTGSRPILPDAGSATLTVACTET